jgi:hypothetical protein
MCIEQLGPQAPPAATPGDWRAVRHEPVRGGGWARGLAQPDECPPAPAHGNCVYRNVGPA